MNEKSADSESMNSCVQLFCEKVKLNKLNAATISPEAAVVSESRKQVEEVIEKKELYPCPANYANCNGVSMGC